MFLRRRSWRSLLPFVLLLLAGCASAPQATAEISPTSTVPSTMTAAIIPPDVPAADVIDVMVSGEANAYRFSVEVRSPDEGCDQYADWWEILTEDGALLYRRILAHSHVNEQPFIRSGGPVDITPDEVVFVRAHMHPGGYGGQVMQGSVETGFDVVSIAADFAADVETFEPQPSGCAF